ncbi:hypothetical protein KCU67_g11871, partial [Aureobasidium melanogenum]
MLGIAADGESDDPELVVDVDEEILVLLDEDDNLVLDEVDLLDVCFNPGDVLTRDAVEEDLLLLVLVEDGRLRPLNLVEDLIEVLMLAIVDDVEIFLLLDLVDDTLVKGLIEDDDGLKVDWVGFDDVFFDEGETFEIV